MREVKLESNQAALEFAERLIRGEIDVVLFLTGVGVRALMDAVQTKFDREAFLAALRKTRIVTRGPKPEAVLRELQVKSIASAPEPNTWLEVLATMDRVFGGELPSLRVAVQEYGASNPELLAGLTERSAEVIKVPVYQWALPHDLQPLRESADAIAHGGIDVILFTTAVQVIHLMMIAKEMGSVPDLMRGLRSVAVISIGPTTTAELLHYGITPDFEPSRPKLGFLVNEAAQYAAQVIADKRKRAAALGPELLPEEQPIDPTSPASVSTLESTRSRVRKVRESTSTTAGFNNGLEPAMPEVHARDRAGNSAE
jgi:uroporphyrinogen-III synthase